MIVKFEPKGDRDAFHADNRVNGIVSMLLEDDTIVYEEIINLINYTFDYNAFSVQISSLIELFGNNLELQESFWKYCVHLQNIYRDGDCANLRGALLEKFVYDLLKLKYNNDSSCNVSCFISIGEWKSQKTIDVLYYSNISKLGESFECKVSPYRLEKDHFTNLKDIYFKSNESIQPNIACFTKKRAIGLKIEELKVSTGPIKIFGRENLKNIRFS